MEITNRKSKYTCAEAARFLCVIDLTIIRFSVFNTSVIDNNVILMGGYQYHLTLLHPNQILLHLIVAISVNRYCTGTEKR